MYIADSLVLYQVVQSKFIECEHCRKETCDDALRDVSGYDIHFCLKSVTIVFNSLFFMSILDMSEYCCALVFVTGYKFLTVLF